MNSRRDMADRTAVLLACGAVAGPLFVVVFLVAGALRVDYDPLRHPVSSLAIGGQGWVQVASFLVTGALLLAFAVGLRADGDAGTWVPVLLGLVAVGLLGAGAFLTDPVSGYPLGTPPQPFDTTPSGTLHDLFSAPVFLALPAACFVLARRLHVRGRTGWALGSVAAGVVFLAAFGIAGLGFAQHPLFVAVGGLFQRLALVVGFGWVAALAVQRLARRKRTAAADGDVRPGVG
jgi:hypothetical protein